VNRLRHRKSRVRENRQSNDDQRSLGSIGYIGGSIGYMGGSSMGMEFPYEHNSGHYQLWKPPGNYYPRGEAPPPYSEAVALAQAESLNTCTVRLVSLNFC
jgi:hypothetical protein